MSCNSRKVIVGFTVHFYLDSVVPIEPGTINSAGMVSVETGVSALQKLMEKESG